MTDLLGPAAAGCPRTLPATDPSITSTIQFPAAGDSFFGDCVANTPGTGTPPNSEYENRFLQQLRRVLRNSGVALTYADDQLGYAIQQGLQWVGTFGGAANALTGTMVPAAATLVAGTEIKGLVAATNTGPSTLNVNGIGAFPITGADGTPLIGNEMIIGGVASLIYTGTSFVLLSPGPSIFQRIISVNTTFNVNNSTGNDTTGDGSAGAPWATLTHALKIISTFNLGGNIVTVQLGLTGVAYPGPGAFNAPSNGTLIIQGNAAAQASYVVSGAAVATEGVISLHAGVVSLVGITVSNVSGAAGSATLWARSCSLSIQNVTTQASGSSPSALIVPGLGGQIIQAAGCIFTGSAGAAIDPQNGGFYIQIANGTVTGAPTFSSGFCTAGSGGGFAVGTSGLSWSGTCTGPRYAVGVVGYINSGGSGANFFPGTTAGSPVPNTLGPTGGIYV